MNEDAKSLWTKVNKTSFTPKTELPPIKADQFFGFDWVLSGKKWYALIENRIYPAEFIHA